MSRGQSSFASELYLHFKSVWRGSREQRKRLQRNSETTSEPFGRGREPKTLSATLNAITEDMGWNQQLAESAVAQDWATLVGDQLAEHARVIEIRDGILRVQCDSTAWATELRRMRAQVLTRIHQEHPDAGIEEIKFIAPNAPSWKHGPKSIPGRGPRDTYG